MPCATKPRTGAGYSAINRHEGPETRDFPPEALDIQFSLREPVNRDQAHSPLRNTGTRRPSA